MEGGCATPKALLTGKTVIITGANTGIGLETAVDLPREEPGSSLLVEMYVARGKAAEAERSREAKAMMSYFTLHHSSLWREPWRRILALTSSSIMAV